ncbi:MARVEL-like domain [Penicillium camemberti]|uniref:MARVEL-like domain n=1 Tax=Penicillium camemberti (strain FM 013) TaxID=1429867 RepID=A0A0G4P277_PENC3|nr:MARVEL-like domain [Penicillium camemberti]
MGLRGVQLGLRAWEFLWTLLIMALIGNMIAEAFSGNPATVNYAIYVAVFSMFTLIYLIPASFNIDWAGHPIIMIIVDALNCVFFFCAAIALAAKLECHSCNNQDYLRNNEITNGSNNMTKRCREAQASVAFLWFAWAGFLASVVVSVFMSRSAAGPSRASRAGSRRGGRPNMTQV